MGNIIAKFRKKKSAAEMLDQIQTKIESIEEYRRSTELQRKKIVRRFVLVSLCVYFACLAAFFLYIVPATHGKLELYIGPLIIIPIMLFMVKRLLTWYYSRSIRRKEMQLTSLQDERKRILEEVMNKETYKTAKSILEKYAPEQVKKSVPEAPGASSVHMVTPVLKRSNVSRVGPQTQPLPPQSVIRYRGTVPLSTISSTPLTGSTTNPIPATPATTTTTIIPRPSQQMAAVRHTSPTVILPRGILPRDRSAFDKLVDYLVGDGPSNRYALICKNCSSHNGMALREEFEYLSFSCCYCKTMNPARKTRPVAPKLRSSGLAHQNLHTLQQHITYEENTVTATTASNSDDEDVVDVDDRNEGEAEKTVAEPVEVPTTKSSTEVNEEEEIKDNNTSEEKVEEEVIVQEDEIPIQEAIDEKVEDEKIELVDENKEITTNPFESAKIGLIDENKEVTTNPFESEEVSKNPFEEEETKTL